MRTLMHSKTALLATALVALTLVVSACSVAVPTSVPAPEQPAPEAPAPSTGGEVLTLFVGPNQVPCVGVAPQLCFQVKTAPDGEYKLFYDQIQGFQYEPGFEYELKVSKETRENVPADASRFIWTLVEELSKTAVEPTASLEGTTWQLLAVRDASGQLSMALPDVDATMVLEGGRVTGNASCNNYSGTYTVDGEALTIALGPMTMMACPEPVMAQEQAFVAGLGATASYQLVANQLHLLNADGDVVLVFQPLVATPLTGVTWQAVSYNNGKQAVVSVLNGTTLTAVFGEDGTMSGSAGCNNYMTSYAVDGAAITIQPPASTRMMCGEPEGVMEQEAAFLAALPTAATYTIQGDQLELRTADGALVASFVPQVSSQLMGVTWEVVNFNNTQALVGPLSGTTITAVFGEDGQMSGTAGCNNYSASYTVDGSSITIGPAISTMMMCTEPEGVMDQEMAYLQALSNAASYVVKGDRLDLLTAEGTFVAIYAAQPAAAAAPSAEAVAKAELANLAYINTSVFTGTVQLTNGVYTETVTPDSPLVTSIQLTDFIAPGELNGQPAVATILVSSGGGSGVFYDLAVVTQQDGQWTNVATTFLGDRVTINSLDIADNLVVVDMVTQGPNDPMCCATQQVVNSYELQGDKLIQVSSETIGTVSASAPPTATVESSIVGIVWQWLGNTYSDDSQTAVDDPSQYTMALLPDGTVDLQVDCNRGGGTYTLDGSQITINVATLTRVACPEGTLSEEYVQSLNAAAAYVMDGADLVINLAMDTGNMRFQAAGPAELPAAAPSEPSASQPVSPTVTGPVQTPVDPDAVVGATWKWMGFTDPVNGTQEIANPARYTLQLLPSGTLRVQADCNRGAGRYTVDGASVSMEVSTLTRAACPPGSLSNDFVKYLNGAATWFMQGDELFIDLFADSGTMRFAQ